jgi:ketosteroid isomerase-like protein
MGDTALFEEMGLDPRPDSELTTEQVLARNMKVVDLHFHSENPDDVIKAIALYTDDITWEAPTRGIVMKDPKEVLAAYLGIFETLAYHKTTALRRFATEKYVFDDQIAEVFVVGEPTKMHNFPYPKGTAVSVRLVHIFEMRDGRIAREIAYEMWRKAGTDVAVDDVPEGAVVTRFGDFPGFDD